MRWWKRLIFSVVSLIWGFISLDYLYMAFGLLTNSRLENSQAGWEKRLLLQGAGLLLLLVWFLLMLLYTRLIRMASPRIDLIEKDEKTGKERIRRKWFDILFQYALVLTGILGRWIYLMVYYLPYHV